MFEKAARLKIRFDSAKGALTVEDLYDLPLTSARGVNLNDIAKGLHRQLKNSEEEDFVNRAPSTSANEVLQLKFDIVKHIIDVRLAENETARLAADKKDKKARLMEVIAKKQDAALEGMTLEDLQKMVADL